MPPTSPSLLRVATMVSACIVIGAGTSHAAGHPAALTSGDSPAAPISAPSPSATAVALRVGGRLPLVSPNPAVTAVYPADLSDGVTRMVIGDSLSVSVADSLSAQGFAVDAKVGRQFGAASGVLAAYQEDVPKTLVLALGTNGPVTVRQCAAMVQSTGKRRVFLVTNRVPRSWQSTNNRNLRTCAKDFAERVSVIDWFATSRTRSGYFRPDGYHLSPKGQSAFARLIDKAVDRATSRG